MYTQVGAGGWVSGATSRKLPSLDLLLLLPYYYKFKLVLTLLPVSNCCILCTAFVSILYKDNLVLAIAASFKLLYNMYCC